LELQLLLYTFRERDLPMSGRSEAYSLVVSRASRLLFGPIISQLRGAGEA